MKIFDIELDFDFTDADDLEKIEKQYPETLKKLENIDQTGSASKKIRETCTVLNEFFDIVFGEGTSQKLFGGKSNFAKEMKVFKEIMNAKENQEKALNDRIKL